MGFPNNSPFKVFSDKELMQHRRDLREVKGIKVKFGKKKEKSKDQEMKEEQCTRGNVGESRK